MTDRIVVDPARTVRAVPRGWLGINVNVYLDHDRNPAAQHGGHPDRPIAAALKEMGVKRLRYPGGDKSDSHLWSVPPFDRPRPTVINAEISNNAEAAIAATPNSFERLLGRSGPDLFWNVDAGLPVAGNWCNMDDPSTPNVAECQGTEFGLFQSTTGKFFLDLNGNRELDAAEAPLDPFGQPGAAEDVD